MSVIKSYRLAKYPSHASDTAATTKSANAQNRAATEGDTASQKINGHTLIRAIVITLGRLRRPLLTELNAARLGERFDDQLAHT